MDFQTPKWCCNYIVSLVPKWCMTVLEPTPGEGNLVEALKLRKYDVIAPTNFYCAVGDWYDAVVMNPPFTPMKVGYNFLYESMKLSDDVIALLPWLTIINSEKRTRDVLDFGLVSVTHLPRRTFPGARVQTCVLQMQRGYNGKVVFRFIEQSGDSFRILR